MVLEAGAGARRAGTKTRSVAVLEAGAGAGNLFPNFFLEQSFFWNPIFFLDLAF